MKEIIRKADIVLFAVLVLLGAAASVFALRGAGGDTVVVKVDGEVYGTYALSEDREITVEQNGHINKITIKDGAVQMSESTCKNQVCVHQGAISKGNQSIVCLPNRVIVTIEGEEAETDVISG